MAKTLDDLERLLTDRGYPCRRIHDVCVATRLPTQAYTSLRTGRKSIDVHLSVDESNRLLTMDTPWAFDCRKAAHREAMLACLLAASGKSPLVKAQLDPEHGEVRLRVDCRLGVDGVNADEVLSMLSLIPAFADRWYPHIKDAMEKGHFDASGTRPPAADERLASLPQRSGGVNRIEALLRAWKRHGRDGGADEPPAG